MNNGELCGSTQVIVKINFLKSITYIKKIGGKKRGREVTKQSPNPIVITRSS